jgi:branched-chain amino acid transport system ATP-binding protein
MRLVRQDIRQMLRVVDRAYRLNAGSIRAGGTAQELPASEVIREAYLSA